MTGLPEILKTLNQLAEEDCAITTAQRVEIKRTRSGFARLYVACADNSKPETGVLAQAIAEQNDCWTSPFQKKGVLVSFTVGTNKED